MKNKFKIKATCKDGMVCIETYGTRSDLLIGFRCITKSLIMHGDIPKGLIMVTVKDAIKEAIEEAEHELTEHD